MKTLKPNKIKLTKEEVVEHNNKERAKVREPRIIQLLERYTEKMINARFYLARANMMAVQIKGEKIYEKIEGVIKPKELFIAEYGVQRMMAIRLFRQAYFIKGDLLKWDCSIERMENAVKDYYEGKIIKDEYDEIYNPRNQVME